MSASFFLYAYKTHNVEWILYYQFFEHASDIMHLCFVKTKCLNKAIAVNYKLGENVSDN